MPTSPSPRVRRTIALVALAGAAACTWLALWITDQELWQHRPLGWLPLYPARLVLLLAAGAALVVAGLYGAVRSRSPLGRHCGAATFAAGSTLLLLEAVFMFVPRSHNVGYTLASRIWHHLYWHPQNALGYRDHEHVRVPGKKLVFAVGDSFTAGGGIADPADRWPDRLAAAHSELHVLNLGANGADTADEYRRLLAHPLQPDVVVLQHYPNDIEGAAARRGLGVPPFAPYEDLASVKMRFLVRSSFLLNFAYWGLPHTDSLGYVHALEHAWGDPEVEREHLADLERFCTWAHRRGVPLVVVMFPTLNDVAGSDKLTAGVRALLARRGVPVVDVAELVADLPAARATVNNQDAHASALVHERVAVAVGKVLATQ